MIHRFFLFKSAGIENGAIGREVRFRFAERGGELGRCRWPCAEALASCAPFDSGRCLADMSRHPVLSRLPDGCVVPVRRIFRSDPVAFEDAGLVVKCHVRNRENLFAALLGFARKHGLSLADPCFGLLLLTPERESIRGRTWLRLRRQQVAEWFSEMVGNVAFLRLWGRGAEDGYAAVHGFKSGPAEPASAIRFRESLREASFPDEKLELHRGRVVLAGPGGAYRIHFDWEGCGKHAEWTADFRDPDCPVVPLGRISARLLREELRRRRVPAGVPAGMFDPRVVACIPDPADRYAGLALFNRKLVERIPRDLLEELQRKREERP